MKKIILIICIAMISSFSYYGKVNEQGERVTNFENILEEQQVVENIEEKQNNNSITELVNESKNEQKENKKSDNKQQQIQYTDENEKQQINTKTETKSKVEIKNKTTTKSKAETNNISKEDKAHTNKEQKQITSTDTSYTEKEVQVIQKSECINNNHKISSGNTKKWFDTKTQADNYYNAEIERFDKQWQNDKITKEEYLKKCPLRL